MNFSNAEIKLAQEMNITGKGYGWAYDEATNTVKYVDFEKYDMVWLPTVDEIVYLLSFDVPLYQIEIGEDIVITVDDITLRGNYSVLEGLYRLYQIKNELPCLNKEQLEEDNGETS